MNTFWFIDSEGRDVTGTEAVAGYKFADYFPGVEDIHTASDHDLSAAYQGPDCEGVGVAWVIG